MAKVQPKGRVAYLIHNELAYEKLPWHRRTVFQLSLLAACLLVFLSVVLGWPVASLLQRRHPRESALPPRLALWVGWGMSVTFFVFVLAFSIEAYESDVLLYGLTPAARVILILPLVGAALATATLILTLASWMGWGTPARRPYWDLPGRVHYTLLAVAGVAFIWWLGDWNLLDFRF